MALRPVVATLALLVAACNGATNDDAAKTDAKVELGPPTFARDVAPILDRVCAPCHFDGGPAPFALIDYDDVRDHASQIVEVTQSRYMPPWLPEHGTARYQGERRLTDGELATISQWVDSGREQGDPADRPTPPANAPGGWRLGAPDVVLETSEPFTLPADGMDVYRNFVIRVPPEADGWIKTVELQPGNPKVAHHAVMRVDRTGQSAERDAEDPAPGFDGMDFAGALMPDGRFIGWTPGKAPDPGQVARSFRLVEGSDVVLQVHMRPSGKPEKVQPRIGLYFSDRPATRRALAMELSSTDIDLPPGATDVHVRDSYVLPIDSYVLSVYPHAHYLGKQLHGWAELPDGTKKWLAKIDDWNFDWQDQYRFAEPLRLPAGTKILMDYSFDNSASNPHNPTTPPKHVRFGQASTDEMAELILEIEPEDPAKLAELDGDFMKAWLDRQLRHFDQQIAANPKDVRSLLAAASLEARRGQPDAAIARFEAALALEPRRYNARIDEAIVLTQLGKLERAQTQLERALVDAPDDPRVHLTLGNLLRKRNDLKGAIEHLLRTTQLDPKSTDAWNNLAVTLEADRQLPEAQRALEAAVELAPKRTLIRENLARVLAAQGKDADAIAAYRALLEQDERNVAGLKGMAVMLLRNTDQGTANTYKAADLADRANRITGGTDPTVLEVLSTAYHASGKLDRAIAAARAGLRVAKEAGDATMIDRLQSQLDRLNAIAAEHG
ncbi:MAG TPA: tetratricopeptide repeat protein [Nannocystaceae bacterium]|nr:tetratricopeptide repeat protein [Nannocystaceae bacterium]